MNDLDIDARRLVETHVDYYLKNPRNTEKFIRFMLKEQGIEPNLETVLSFITGSIYGYVVHLYRIKHDRDLTHKEDKELADLLGRRAFELREAFISTRIE